MIGLNGQRMRYEQNVSVDTRQLSRIVETHSHSARFIHEMRRIVILVNAYLLQGPVHLKCMKIWLLLSPLKCEHLHYMGSPSPTARGGEFSAAVVKLLWLYLIFIRHAKCACHLVAQKCRT